ncbi:hypothetical protein DENSPDRAFT_878979 [Dentipellis sp. KUC8613]|nr:hypothetical protein DENSPDRAFT_878979 [Dentipellis sp. KUC8613]
MIPITTLGWTCDGLLSRSPRFRAVPRISILDPSLSATIDAHTSSGTPLIIEDLHRHPRWPKEMFGVDWFATHGPQEVNVRDVCKRKDSKMPIADFISKSRAASIYATAEEPNRYYAKDAECPKAWADWLYDARLIPETFVPHGSDDLSKYLPKNQSVETLMCYLGIGDTFTPCHKDLCASSGHNLMCYTENNGSSFWFMTQSSQASTVANYFHELGEELDWETHTISVDELVKAPFDTYIGEQKLGDFMLVPPRSCHQVVNQGGLTVKTSWSRMTLKGLATALHDELPIYRR